MIVAPMLSIRFAIPLFVVALILSGASTARAQTPEPLPIELYAGYSYLRDPGGSVLAATESDDSFHVGWTAGAARRIWRRVAAVGEVSGHYKTRTTFDEDVHLSYHAFLGGARASIRVGRFEEFGQALAGAVRAHGSAFGVTVTKTALAVQPGGGVDYRLTPRLAARVQLDYRWIRGSDRGGSANQFRASAAIVVR